MPTQQCQSTEGPANVLHHTNLKCCYISQQPITLYTLCILEVVSPQWPNLVLTTDIPHSEADVLIFDRFHIEAYTKWSRKPVYAVAHALRVRHFYWVI